MQLQVNWSRRNSTILKMANLSQQKIPTDPMGSDTSRPDASRAWKLDGVCVNEAEHDDIHLAKQVYITQSSVASNFPLTG